jgi:hypothetical protein
MAGAYTAGPESLDTLYYNPGGLGLLNQRELSFTHTEWLQEATYDYAAVGLPTKIGGFALSAARLGYGDLEGRDASRRPTGDFDAHDSAYGISYGGKLAGVGVGAAVKIVERKIDRDEVVSYALDFGGIRQVPGGPLRVGAAVLNVGPGMRFIDQNDPLPLTLALGAAYERSRSLVWAADLKHEPHDERTTVMTGLEYSPLSLIALRAGYQFPLAHTDDALWDLDNARTGIGLQISRFRLDYALVPFGDLGLTHRFTLSLQWGPKPPSGEHNILKPAQSSFLE